jgi:hypothetical protein
MRMKITINCKIKNLQKTLEVAWDYAHHHNLDYIEVMNDYDKLCHGKA